MLKFISRKIESSIPNEIEYHSYKDSKGIIKYMLNYGKERQSGILKIQPIMELILFDVIQGAFVITNSFEMPKTKDLQLVYKAMEKSIKEFNEEIGVRFDLLAAYPEFGSYVCPDFKTLEKDIIAQVFF